jgi:hypothetical protein
MGSGRRTAGRFVKEAKKRFATNTMGRAERALFGGRHIIFGNNVSDSNNRCGLRVTGVRGRLAFSHWRVELVRLCGCEVEALELHCTPPLSELYVSRGARGMASIPSCPCRSERKCPAVPPLCRCGVPRFVVAYPRRQCECG